MRPTFLITLFALIIVFLYVIFNRKQSTDNINKIQFLEASILIIASLQYMIVLNISDPKRYQRWRYLDWALTTPLLLGTFYLTAVEKGYNKSIIPAIIANEIMIVSGYWSEYPETSPLAGYFPANQIRWFFFVLGFLALAVVFVYVNEWNSYLQDQNIDTGFLPYFFYIGWVLYSLIFLVKDTFIRQSAFDVLDLFNKPIYTIYLTNFIEKEIK